MHASTVLTSSTTYYKTVSWPQCYTLTMTAVRRDRAIDGMMTMRDERWAMSNEKCEWYTVLASCFLK